MKSARRSRKPPRSEARFRWRARAPSRLSSRRLSSQKVRGRAVLVGVRAARVQARRPLRKERSVRVLGVRLGGRWVQRGSMRRSLRGRRGMSNMVVGFVEGLAGWIGLMCRRVYI